MSNDLHDDLTDEEKALLKREMAQQRDREDLEGILPQLFLVGGVISFLVMLLLLSSSMNSGTVWLILVCGIPGALLTLIGAGTLWEMGRSQKAKRSDKIKRKRK